MQYIILIGDKNFTLNSIKSVKHYDSVKCYEITEMNGRYCIDYGEDHIFYDYTTNIINDYEESDINKIPFKEPHFIMMIYQLEERMKKVLQQDNYIRNIYVDNDYGLIIPIEKFIQLGMPVSYIQENKANQSLIDSAQ